MPYINAKLTIKLDNEQKEELQHIFLSLMSDVFNKPTSFVMTNIEDNTELRMGDKKLEKGAYIEIKLFGNTNKSACNVFSKKICESLDKKYDIASESVYITYFPVDLWGWNSQMF